jgi:hypothetical protein
MSQAEFNQRKIQEYGPHFYGYRHNQDGIWSRTCGSEKLPNMVKLGRFDMDNLGCEQGKVKTSFCGQIDLVLGRSGESQVLSENNGLGIFGITRCKNGDNVWYRVHDVTDDKYLVLMLDDRGDDFCRVINEKVVKEKFGGLPNLIDKVMMDVIKI